MVKDGNGHGTNPKRFVEAGQRFGRLTVVNAEVRRIVPSVPNGLRAADCQCDCGTVIRTAISLLVHGKALSCGCARREVTAERLRSHGLHEHPLYNVHHGMMQRCYDKQHQAYENYGGRGIEVCPEWHDLSAFTAWIDANLGPRPEGMTLDRWPDNDGNYEPGNVRWATKVEQAANRRRREP